MANVVFNPGSEAWNEAGTLSQLAPRMPDEGAVATRSRVIGWVKMAPDVLRAMTIAAQHAGRTASDVWAEAAREWLLHRALDADYDVLANSPVRGKSAPPVMRTNLWHSIDSMMDDLRQDRPTL